MCFVVLFVWLGLRLSILFDLVCLMSNSLIVFELTFPVSDLTNVTLSKLSPGSPAQGEANGGS